MLQNAIPHIYGLFLDEEHSAIGEQAGIQRDWYINDLGEAQVGELCVNAWESLGRVVGEAHEFVSKESADYELPEHNPDPSLRVLTETELDLDPTLAEKWGWVD
jgi:hypothetical protein